MVRRGAALALACALVPRLHAAEALRAPGPESTTVESAPGKRAGFSRWEFEVRSEGKSLGTLVFDFVQEGQDLVVRRQETLSGRKLLIRFRLDQRTTERWRGADLQAFEGHSVSDTSLGNEKKRLRVWRGEAGTLLAEADAKALPVPATAWPATFWNMDFMGRDEVFDVKTGQRVKLSTQPQGKETHEADGRPVECARYSAKLSVGTHSQDISFWYDALGRLCGLRQESGGDVVEYVRVRSE